MSLQRLSHAGAAPPSGLVSPINASVLTFGIISGVGFPTGANGPFVLVLDPGQPAEEKVLCSSLTGTTVTVMAGGRGWDGTTAAAHGAAPGNVAHVFSAAEADDANAHIYNTARNDHPQYILLNDTGWLAITPGPNCQPFPGFGTPLCRATQTPIGMMTLSGVMNLTAQIPAGGLIGTVPSPHYPTVTRVLTVMTGNNDTPLRLDANTDGTLTVSETANLYVSFDGVTYAL